MIFLTADYIWRQRYRYERHGRPVDQDLPDTWRRVAKAVASVEAPEQQSEWFERFFHVMNQAEFIPAGRIIAGAGTEDPITLFNCFVMGRLESTADSVFRSLEESVRTMQCGGGVGYDFSELLPKNAPVDSVFALNSGPVAVMKIWDAACAALLSGRSRRGAMMATLRCDHPDVEAFIAAKSDPADLRCFNCSVLITEAFLKAIEGDQDWSLVFPEGETAGQHRESLERYWAGHGKVNCVIHKRVPARELWRRLMQATYDYSEPGVLFIDRINRQNNLYYCEEISATNPCGEIPLPPYGACDLGSINLARLVREPFSPGADIDWQRLRQLAAVGTRMLDNVIDLSRFPLPQQANSARASRRIGLGIMGLADCLMMLGLDYGSEDGRQKAASIMETVRDSAYATSIQLAREKSPFPLYDAKPYLAGDYVSSLPDHLREGIARHGIRNSHLTAIAPTGTISLLAGNVASGLEPVFLPRYERQIRDRGGNSQSMLVENYACRRWAAIHGRDNLPPKLVTATELSPLQHLRMVAALQPYVDNAIAKTITVAEDCDFETFQSIYSEAYSLGLKGCTTYRSNPVTGAVLTC